MCNNETLLESRPPLNPMTVRDLELFEKFQQFARNGVPLYGIPLELPSYYLRCQNRFTVADRRGRKFGPILGSTIKEWTGDGRLLIMQFLAEDPVSIGYPHPKEDGKTESIVIREIHGPLTPSISVCPIAFRDMLTTRRLSTNGQTRHGDFFWHPQLPPD